MTPTLPLFSVVKDLGHQILRGQYENNSRLDSLKGFVKMIGYTQPTKNDFPWVSKFVGLKFPHSGVMLVNSNGSTFFCTKTTKPVVCRYYDNILFKSIVTDFCSPKTHKTVQGDTTNDNIDKWLNDKTQYSIFNIFGGKNCYQFTKSVFVINDIPLEFTTRWRYVIKPFM